MKPTPVRRILWVLAILLVLALLMAGLARAEPVRITDGRGRVVTIAQPPQRIASLLPSLTESVCALGECQRIVGVIGRRVDESSPICDARLPDGSRVNVIIPPLAVAWSLGPCAMRCASGYSSACS